MASTGDYGDDFDEDEERKQFQQQRRSASSAAKSKTPVLDHFGNDFTKVIEADKEQGIVYFPRKSEIDKLLKIFLKKGKQHLAIIGEYGSGRETLIKSVAEKIYAESNPLLNDLTFKSLDLELLVSGTKYQGQLEERLKAIYDESAESHCVIFIRDIYSYINDENTSGTQILGRLVKNKKMQIVTVFTEEEADRFFGSNILLKKYFHLVRINPLNKKDSKVILSTHISRFENYYAIKVEEDILDSIIDYSNLYFHENAQPYRSIFLLEEVCASIELTRNNNPGDTLYELKVKFKKLIDQIEDIRSQKNIVVKNQKFEQAASLRDKEKRTGEALEKLKKEIVHARLDNKERITIDDVISVVNTLTDIDIDIIRKKETIQLSSSIAKTDNNNSLPQYEFLQAQSILQGHQVLIKRGTAFVLLPHSPEFEDLFNHYIFPAFEHHGINVLKGNSIYNPGNILSQVWSQIRSAEIIVADVSGKNANVIFELGLCYGIQRCPILLTRDPTELPFNIRNLRYIQYENTASGAHKLMESLKTTIGEFLSAVRTEGL